MTIPSVTSPSVTSTHPTFAPVPGTTRVGSLASTWHRDEPILLGEAVPGTFRSFDDAVAGAAGLADSRGGDRVFGIGADADHSYHAYTLLQPVWTKGFLRQDVDHTEQLELAPTYDGSGRPTFDFHVDSVDGYGTAQAARVGTVKLDPSHFPLQAVVGRNWSFVDGQLQNVEGRFPEPPVEPAPPVHPAPPAPPVHPAPPAPPTDSTSPTGKTLVEDVTEAVRLANASARIIQTVPVDDHGDESTKATRIQAYKTNMEAQKRLENQFGVLTDAGVLSTMRTADASLEDANWQLAKKPSPDGRFNGVDIPGALSDTKRAVDLLTELLHAQTSAAPASGNAPGGVPSAGGTATDGSSSGDS